ncbi:type II CRISPR RNA-guided endonuclease Cas9 [Arenibacter sp. 6A1]|uniref:type II CRISPR RNA-guided endonuclease Cas9 n=1 Tax=Arenibacter sp. 6A1 TaxID=2720391 RepID=UPI001447A8C0|nr:type II CRISPR RNA-guided endonuclease Cas9 [Arenibacter sp. 6A1]NKI27961.1 type II CRISPR RNA-guided endonuclease Cas9 [Arenibacter sp. 6A1]
MKRILGLDLGTTSIGWAFVNEADSENEVSAIVRTGVRVIPLSTDEQQDFTKGNTITINADRTLKRGMRRNLQRYKQRREAVIEILTKIGFITKETALSEQNKTTHSTYELRAKAPSEKISKEDFARVLLMINKKRGYKSSRKANNQEEGQLIDGMAVAKRLNNEKLTPGQLSYCLIKEGKKLLPDYYRSDLQGEFDAIWNFQKQFYPNYLTDFHKEALQGLNKTTTGQYFEKKIGTERAENKGATKKLQEYEWRTNAISGKLSLPQIAYILTEINNQINQSSGYLGAISDRSKELYFNNLTVGQFQYNLIKTKPHTSLKNQVFYRQDYMDEFDAIWKEQSKYYPELTEEIRKELRDITIFYQRRLKSQKGLINICEFESVERDVTVGNTTKKKLVGPRVAPKSSPVFQQAKVWQNINAIRVSLKSNENEFFSIEDETKQLLFNELNLVESMKDRDFLKWLFKDSKNNAKDWKINFESIEGNRTQSALFSVYKKIVELEGYDKIDYGKPTKEIIEILRTCFEEIGIDPKIFNLDMGIVGNNFSKQPGYQLWHLLYSYEDDDSTTGTESLLNKLQSNFGFNREHAQLLAAVTFQEDYGGLSVRALRKIYPFLEEGKMYDEACKLAGYNHSNSITAEENKERLLQDRLEILKKNSLRNPVVEKILNQMINVVNAIMDDPDMGRPDEIRVELARELKKTAKQRKEMTQAIGKATKEHIEYREKIKKEFGLSYVSRKDLIKYKLYLELKSIGFKTLYSGTYIKPEELFTNKFDVEHIIPQSVLFDDSFSNKTIELRDVNLEKGNETAFDYCERKGWAKQFDSRVQEVFAQKGIFYGKLKKLLMSKADIPEGFLNRDLGNSAYIARKASELLKGITRTVSATSGTITDKLRSDWELINVLQELTWDKYEKLDLTFYEYNKEGKALPRIIDWTKRNDHRHHAMDAITVAFTKPAFVQYLNNMNADSNKDPIIYAIKEKYTYRDNEGGRKFKKPFDSIREEAKKHLASILVSHKTKNKVVTLNKNKTKIKGKEKYKTKIELTPRGQLHKETIYGKNHIYDVKEEKINASFDKEKIGTVTKPIYREALLKRLELFDNDPKKAFAGKNALTKNPIFINGSETNVPDKVKTQTVQSQFTIRKEITPDLKIDKVVDEGVKRILQDRLKLFNGKPKEAFANLDENPIWLNKEKGIQIKRVTITGVSNAEPLHIAKDLNGKEIFDGEGKEIPVDYVSTGNNHHVAIYRDDRGNLIEEVVSFYEAVTRKSMRHPIVKKNHEKGWEFMFTMKQNEMFVFPKNGFNPDELDLMDLKNKSEISENMFRVQKISTKNYVFNHHLETEAVGAETFKTKKMLADVAYRSCRSEKHLEGAVKVRINHLGNIVHVGEY